MRTAAMNSVPMTSAQTPRPCSARASVRKLPVTIDAKSAIDFPRNSMRLLNMASGSVPKALMMSRRPTARRMSVSSGVLKKPAARGAPFPA